jgi:hypothetical protein
MRRALTGLLIAVATLGFAACVGDTDPATNVRATQARLNAHGYTNDGPATWWWEYDTVRAELGTANDTEVCGSGTGPKEPDARCGPASGGSQQNQIRLNVVVTGLTSQTTYYFRACGQDTNDPAPSCGRILSFQTTRGDSTGSVSGGVLTFAAAAGTENNVAADRFVDTDGITKYRLEDPVSYDTTYGTSIVPGAGCTSFSGRSIDDAVKCPVGVIASIRMELRDLTDGGGISAAIAIPSTLDGGGGNDALRSFSAANALVIGGPGQDNAVTGGGDDRIEFRDGQVDERIDCGEGHDTAVIDSGGIDELFGPPFACEQVERG